jgi:AcrR family transcriptional regulator
MSVVGARVASLLHVAEPEAVDELDGRVARRQRNRDAVVDAIMVLIESGDLDPNLARVAEVAGVSERSIFRHFETRDALIAAVVDRQLERVLSLVRDVPSDGPLDARVHALVAERARMYEAITPMRRVALRVAERSELVAEKLREAQRWNRAELERVFAAELNPRATAERREVVAAGAMVAGWEAWDVLRTREGCSVTRAVAIVERLLGATIAR